MEIRQTTSWEGCGDPMRPQWETYGARHPRMCALQVFVPVRNPSGPKYTPSLNEVSLGPRTTQGLGLGWVKGQMGNTRREGLFVFFQL